jgi:hypothetical protein
MDKKVCHRVRQLLSLYLDGELNPRENKSIAEHISQCKECASELEQLSSIKRAAKSLERHKPPEYLFYRIKNEIARQARTKSRRARLTPRRRWVLAPAFGTLLIIIGLVIIFRSREPLPMVELAYQSYKEEAIAPLEEYGERLKDLNLALDDCQDALRENPGNRQVLKAIVDVYNEEVETINQLAMYGR